MERRLAPEMVTDRCVLRPIELADLEPLHEFWTSAGVRRFLLDDQVISVDRTRAMIETSAELMADRGYGLWAGWHRETGALVGVVGFWMFREPPDLEFLFAVAEEYWEQGYASELGRAVIAHGFEDLGMSVIRASTDAPNAASIRALETLGFRHTRRATIGGLDILFYEMSAAARQRLH